jgi:hypothetical protein
MTTKSKVQILILIQNQEFKNQDIEFTIDDKNYKFDKFDNEKVNKKIYPSLKQITHVIKIDLEYYHYNYPYGHWGIISKILISIFDKVKIEKMWYVPTNITYKKLNKFKNYEMTLDRINFLTNYFIMNMIKECIKFNQQKEIQDIYLKYEQTKEKFEKCKSWYLMS